MPRAIDVILTNPQMLGFDMTTNARELNPNPSLANGCSPVAMAAGNTAAGSPGAVLGTGMNADRYITTLETV